jgi:predicted dehydrogenase
MSDNLFRWGIISTAKIGREQVLPAIAQSESGVIHAIASRNGARAAAEAARWSAAKAYDNYNALLADPDVDGVYIPLPTSQHTEWAIRAANAGKHVLCEKPIALKASDIERIIKARDTNDVVLSEAFMVWYHPQWHKVRDLISSGAIGTLRHVTGAFSYHLLDAENMRNRPELGGGALPDIGVYPIVTTLMATGGTAGDVRAQVVYSPEFGNDIYAKADIAFDGFNLTFHVATQMAQHQSMRFFGDKGWIDVNAPFNAGLYGMSEVTLHNQSNQEEQVFRFSGSQQYLSQVDAFDAACSGDRSGVFPLEKSREVQQIIDAIYAAGGPRP